MARHRIIAMRGIHACQSFPPKDRFSMVIFQQTDAGRVCVAQFKSDLDELLQNVSWLVGHLLGQLHQGVVFDLIIRGTIGPPGKLRFDVYVI